MEGEWKRIRIRHVFCFFTFRKLSFFPGFLHRVSFFLYIFLFVCDACVVNFSESNSDNLSERRRKRAFKMRLETRLHARFAKLAYYQFRKYFEIEFSQFNHEIGDARRSGKRMRFYSFSFETSNKHSRRGKPFSRICILAASVYTCIFIGERNEMCERVLFL